MVNGFQSFFLDDPLGTDSEILTETIMQYYSVNRHPPHEILLPSPAEDSELVEEQLTELRGTRCRLLVPQRGKRMQLMTMAASNAKQVFAERDKKERAWQALSDALMKELSLTRPPVHIECVDISNLQGKQAVGSLVCFHRGEKNKSGYRHYRIREKDTPDDYTMMHEVLHRRLERVKQNKGAFPDLLLLDGGKGQLAIAEKVTAELLLQDKIELVAIAKEKAGEGEKLFRPGQKAPILLPAHAPALLYLMRIRDESHRFGITKHRQLRRGATITSKIDTLQGVGTKRKKLLLKTFGSYKKICAASEEELCRVQGIGPLLAASIFEQLQSAGNSESR
jgi:excinuclease ABC subunit C